MHWLNQNNLFVIDVLRNTSSKSQKKGSKGLNYLVDSILHSLKRSNTHYLLKNSKKTQYINHFNFVKVRISQTYLTCIFFYSYNSYQWLVELMFHGADFGRYQFTNSSQLKQVEFLWNGLLFTANH
jgi:hypothetical protein